MIDRQNRTLGRDSAPSGSRRPNELYLKVLELTGQKKEKFQLVFYKCAKLAKSLLAKVRQLNVPEMQAEMDRLDGKLKKVIFLHPIDLNR